MGNEESVELEDKLARVKDYLKQMKNEKITYDKGKIIFKRVDLISNSDEKLIIIAVISWILTGILKSTIVFVIGIILIAIVFFLNRKNKTDRFLVLDYENKVIYYDIRKDGKSISKEIIIDGKNLISIGINNRYVEAGARETSDNMITNEIHESAVAFLKNDGNLLYFTNFVKSKFLWIDANNRLMAKVISELFDKPLLDCSHDMELKVIKSGTTFKLTQKPLEKQSVAHSIIKQVFTTVVSFILVMLFMLVIMFITEKFGLLK